MLLVTLWAEKCTFKEEFRIYCDLAEYRHYWSLAPAANSYRIWEIFIEKYEELL